MRMYDIIEKKKRGGILCREEIAWMVQGFVRGNIPDYQMSAMLMAIYFQGMEDGEITDLTLEMAHSGDMVDLSPIKGVKVDKHSTGGVGDKTTLIAGPLAAACGVKVAKMSGRGLGHTGGTVDKLESIPGFRTEIPREEFFPHCKRARDCGDRTVGKSGPGGQKTLRPPGCDGHSGQHSPHRLLYHEQETGRGERRHCPGCEDGKRRLYERSGVFPPPG